jgi:hypothetical protein
MSTSDPRCKRARCRRGGLQSKRRIRAVPEAFIFLTRVFGLLRGLCTTLEARPPHSLRSKSHTVRRTGLPWASAAGAASIARHRRHARDPLPHRCAPSSQTRASADGLRTARLFGARRPACSAREANVRRPPAYWGASLHHAWCARVRPSASAVACTSLHRARACAAARVRRRAAAHNASASPSANRPQRTHGSAAHAHLDQRRHARNGRPVGGDGGHAHAVARGARARTHARARSYG